MRFRTCLFIVASSLALLSASCAKAPPPSFYLLDVAAPTQLPGLEKGVTVGVGPVETARYLDRNQIVTRTDTARLRVSERNQWAEPLKAGFTRALMINLGLELDSNRIYELPMRRRRPLDFQIPIDVLRFDGILGKQVVLSARWTVLSGDGKKILVSKVSRIIEAVEGPSFDTFVAAQSRALAQLSREIAAAIKARAPIDRA